VGFLNDFVATIVKTHQKTWFCEYHSENLQKKSVLASLLAAADFSNQSHHPRGL
jgi:hypothetical protein